MAETWYTSDWHFGHRNILNYCQTFRPFTTVDEMNEGLVDVWNRQVAPDDTVWFVGDACMGVLDETLKVIGRLNGTIVLVAGNHDAPAPMHHKSKKGPEQQAFWTARYVESGFSEVHTGTLDTVIGGRRTLVGHFPYDGDHTDDVRYAEHRPADDGVTPIVHGHVHDAWVYNGRQMNVGFDAWGRLVHVDEVAAFVGRFQ